MPPLRHFKRITDFARVPILLSNRVSCLTQTSLGIAPSHKSVSSQLYIVHFLIVFTIVNRDETLRSEVFCFRVHTVNTPLFFTFCFFFWNAMPLSS